MSRIAISETTIAVTGAARGLGRAMTLALLRAGANVAALDLRLNDPEFSALRAEAQRDGNDARLLVVAGDIKDPRQCEEMLESAVVQFGTIHGLVNNAGIGMQGFGAVLVGDKPKFYDIPPDAWRMVFDTNINGAFMMARAALHYFLPQHRGKIVNITTSVRTMQMVGFSPYGPTKAALEAATVIWAKDLAGSGITVNALLPGGAANTRMIPDGEVLDRSKLVQPAKMGPPIVWLMSGESDGVSGRRFIASEWDDAVPPLQAAEKCGTPAGWS